MKGHYQFCIASNSFASFNSNSHILCPGIQPGLHCFALVGSSKGQLSGCQISQDVKLAGVRIRAWFGHQSVSIRIRFELLLNSGR